MTSKTRLHCRRAVSLPFFLAVALASASTVAATAQDGDGPAQPACNAERYGVILHGGTARAGSANQQRLDFMKSVLTDLRADLADGAAAVDVVEAGIVAMEDSGLFNAGKGAISNAGGFVETDASIMDGASMEAGAVASMRTLKNPISAARIVMDETRHVMMVGDRGETAVTQRGAQTVAPGYFSNNAASGADPQPHDEPDEHGTVGAAVLDRCGNLAAGTSTGGYDAKIPGRVGDSPIIGAGSYAKNGVLAASATGHGEYFIRYSATRAAAGRMEFGGADLPTATRGSIDEMQAAGKANNARGTDGLGGLIAIDAEGNVAFPFSTEGMYRGYADEETAWSVGVYDSMETARAR